MFDLPGYISQDKLSKIYYDIPTVYEQTNSWISTKSGGSSFRTYVRQTRKFQETKTISEQINDYSNG